MTPLEQKCLQILTALLGREPSEQEIGNMMTDTYIVNKAMMELLSP